MTPGKTTSVARLIAAALTRHRPSRHDRHPHTTPQASRRTRDRFLDGTVPDPKTRFQHTPITGNGPTAQPADGASRHTGGTDHHLRPARPAPLTPSTRPPAAPGGQPAAGLLTSDRPTGPIGTIRLLGRYSIEAHTLVTGQPRDPWMLLALLAEYRHAPLPRATIIGRLWPDQDHQVSTGRFWTVIKEARTKLCQALIRPAHDGKHVIENLGAGTYRLNQGLFHTDVWRLRDALTRARNCPPEQRPAALADAVALYSGPYLPGADHGWARNTAHALDRDVVDALSRLADLEPDPERAAAWLERATKIDPTCEHLYRRRMHLYADHHHYQAVHNCYAELVDHLHIIGARPERRTTHFYRQLIAQAD